MSGEIINNQMVANSQQDLNNFDLQNLSSGEHAFFQYWHKERTLGWRSYSIYVVGFRYGLVFSCTLILSIISGWYKRVPFFNYGDWIMISIALFLLTIFMSIFTAAYRREQNEQEYQRILHKIVIKSGI